MALAKELVDGTWYVIKDRLTKTHLVRGYYTLGSIVPVFIKRIAR